MTKARHCSRAAIASVALALACGGGSEDAAPRFDVGAEYAKVVATRATLASARRQLDSAQEGTPGSATAPDVPATRLRDAQLAFDAAYARNQRALARFLNIALNEAPRRPETKEALDSFAKDAVANARYVLEHGADRTQAVAALGRTERAYHGLGLGVPADLAGALDEARRTPTAVPTGVGAPPASGGAGSPGRRPRPRRHGAASPGGPYDRR